MRYTILGVASVLGACFVGCSGSSDSGGASPSSAGGSSFSDAASGGSGAWSGSGGLSAGGGTSSGGSGGGFASGGVGGSTGDAGAADAAPPACESLDDTKNAIFYLSADDSNSMASPAIARGHIQNGQPVPPGFVRIHEFLNYYNVGYPAAPSGQLAITTELRAGELPGTYELQLGVASNTAPKPRRPMNLTFVLDTSGSMSGEPMARQKAAVLGIASQLKAGDRVTMATWNTEKHVVLNAHAISGPNDPALVSAANALSASGGTDLSGGLALGYQIAQQQFAANELNRVILISDGQANVGITDENLIGAGAALNDGDGIYLVGVGVGDGVNDTLMNTVTDKGKGAYVYLDSTAEAASIFGPRFDEVMDVAAREVQVELQLPWYMGISKFYGEEFSTNPAVIEPQHLSPDDAMVFNQIIRPCDPTLVLPDDGVTVIARWKTPLDHVFKQVEVSTTIGALTGATPVYIDKAKAIIAYAEALKLGGAQRLSDAAALVAIADPTHTDPELSEIDQLIETALLFY